MGKAAGGGGGTIVSKTITANGTYNASADNADGYSPVVVNIAKSFASGEAVIDRDEYPNISASATEVA